MALPLGFRSAVVAALAGVLAATALAFGLLVTGPGRHLHAPTWAGSAASAAPRAALAKLPLAFEPNAGRTADEVRFLARGPGYTVFLTQREAVTRLAGAHPVVLRTRLVGARSSEPRAADKQRGIVNSFVGPRKHWRSNIPTYARVVYPSVYSGIDLVYHGAGKSLEYDFEVAPGADPARIAVAIAGTRGMRVDASGDVVLRVPGGALHQERPVAYQLLDGVRHPVTAAWQLRDGRLSFRIGDYDRALPLVIDPILKWSTYYGSSDGEDGAGDVTVDSAGNLYAVGGTDSNTSFPHTPDAFQQQNGGPFDAYVLKLAADGTRVYASYLGGNDVDGAAAVEVDSSGNAYLVGTTASVNMEVPAANPGLNGFTDGFVAKVSPTGSQLLYYRYFGGTGLEDLNDAKLVGGSLWVAGDTTSATGLATTAQAFSGGTDAIVAKIDPSNGTTQIATYLGGSSDDRANGIDLDPSGNVFVAGTTDGPSTFPTTAGSPAASTGSDGFIAKYPATLASRTWSDVIGGTRDDTIAGVAVTKQAGAYTPIGTPYVVGSTNSQSLPGTVGSLHSPTDVASNNNDAFVSRFAAATGAIGVYYDTIFIGGGSSVTDGTSDNGSDIAIDAQSNVYVVGDTASPDFQPEPVESSFTPSSAPPTSTNQQAFALKLTFDLPGSGGGPNTVYSLFMGGSSFDRASAVATDNAGSTFIGGSTASANFPTTSGTAQPAWAGQTDAFFARIGITPAPAISGPSGATKSRNASVSWLTQPAETNLRYTCSFDGVAATNCSSPVTKSNLADGTHTFTMQTYDSGLTPDGGPQTLTWVVDNAAPGSFDLIEPPEGGTTGQKPTLRWGETSDAASGVSTYRLVLDGNVDSEVPAAACSGGTCSAQTSKTLPEGSHTAKVVAVDGVGLTTDSASTRTFTVTASPAPTLKAAPNPAATGRPITFEATSGLDESLVTPKYEWDLDGNGSFERDTGGAATTATSYASAATIHATVKVSTPAGGSGSAAVDLKINSLGSAGQLGVSIENGKQYTNSPDVTVNVAFPSGTSSFLFSNDGGFLNPDTFKPAKEIKWKLDSSGPERLPKTIYVRFLTGPIVSQTYQDDIILDETPPKVQAATVAGAASSAAVRASTLRKFKLKVKATDSNSGVSKIQATANKKKPGKLFTYKRTLTVKLAKRPKFVRARDRAGNYSSWRRLR